MKVLFTTQPAYGHYHPLAPLAHGLQALGHEVIVATGASFAAQIDKSGVLGRPVGIDWQETSGGLVKAFPELRNHPGTKAGNDYVIGDIFARQTALATVEDLVPVIDQWQPDLIVRGTFEFGGALAAELRGIPHVTVQVAAHAVLERNRAALRRGLTAASQELGLPVDDELSFLFRHLLLSFVPPCLQDPEFPLPASAHALRAPLADNYGEAPLPDWLARLPHERTVYMTMGTVFTVRKGPYEATLEALAKEPVNLILTVGHGNDPADFGPQPHNVRIERYIPNSALLPHCDLVICHGGFNTILASLSHGLPLLLLPVSADQPDNARRCDDLGVSVTVDCEVDGSSLRQAALEVLSDPGYRQNALGVEREIQGLPGVEHAIALLEDLARPQAGAAGRARQA